LGTACARLLATNSKDNNQQPRRDLLLLHATLHVLESLSIIENHATWDAMVLALKQILEQLPSTFVSQIYVPMASRLSISPSPTARIVPISLLSRLYPVVSGDVCVQLRGMADRMCQDDNPLVRRAVASIIGDLARAVCLDHELMVWWFVQLVEKASNDTHDIVRIFAVKSCLALAKILASSPSDQEGIEAEESKRLVLCQILPMVNTFVSDSSWQVRLETARLLPELCQVFGYDYSDVFVDHFVAMVKDPTVEVRSACAQAMYELGHVLIELAKKQMAISQMDEIASKLQNVAVSDNTTDLGIDSESCSRSCSVASNGRDLLTAARIKIIRSILPATYKMSTDISVNVRLGLAKSVGQCLQLVGENSYQELVPLFSQFLEDKDANVRAAVVEAMARYCLNSSSLINEMIFPAIKNLISSTQWRIRAISVECICAYAERPGCTLLPEELSETCLKMLSDPVYEVRTTTCSKLPALATALGHEWVVEKAMPCIVACMEQNFHGKVTGLLGFEALAKDLVKVNKIEQVMDIVIQETHSKTANLRFRALRTLGFLVERLQGDAKPFVEKIRAIVIQRSDKEHEPDTDVRETAQKVLVQLKSSE
jgi:serine/threonine-protein phosphatase 2A regulatory subunit A